MGKTSTIHDRKGTFRRHCLAEWLEERRMDPMDLLNALNESGAEEPIQKSQVYRWLKGQLPHKPTQIRIAAVLNLLDIESGEPAPELLMRKPEEVWFALKIRNRSEEERERIKQMIELAFPDRTGTNG